MIGNCKFIHYIREYILDYIQDVLRLELSMIISTMNDDTQRRKYHKRCGRINRVKQAIYIHLCALDYKSHITAGEVGNVLIEIEAENIVM